MSEIHMHHIIEIASSSVCFGFRPSK